MVTHLNHCTQCGAIVATQDRRSHPVLGVLQCSACYQSYLMTEDLTRYRGGVDIQGIDNYCRWCLDGGDLILCSDEACRNSFCSKCIEYNFGAEVCQSIQSSNDWHCFVCDYTLLKGKLVLEFDDDPQESVQLQKEQTAPEIVQEPEPTKAPSSDTNTGNSLEAMDDPKPNEDDAGVSDGFNSPEDITPVTENVNIENNGPQDQDIEIVSVSPVIESNDDPQESVQLQDHNTSKVVQEPEPTITLPSDTDTGNFVEATEVLKPDEDDNDKDKSDECTSSGVITQLPVTENVDGGIDDTQVQDMEIDPVPHVLESDDGPQESAQLQKDHNTSKVVQEPEPTKATPCDTDRGNFVEAVEVLRPDEDDKDKSDGCTSSVVITQLPVTENVNVGISTNQVQDIESVPVSKERDINGTSKPLEDHSYSKERQSLKRKLPLTFNIFSTSRMCSRPHEKKTSDSRQTLTNGSPKAPAPVPTPTPVPRSTPAPTPTSVPEPTPVPPPEPTVALDFDAIVSELDISDTETDNYVEAMEVLKPEEDLKEKSGGHIDSGKNGQTSSTVKAVESAGVVDSQVQDLDIRQALDEHLSKIDVQAAPKASNKFIEWALIDANILKERVSVHCDALGTSLEDFNEDKFRADPMTLLSWASNMEAFLEEAAAIRKRCLHLLNLNQDPFRQMTI